jgi:hypothetical protein
MNKEVEDGLLITVSVIFFIVSIIVSYICGHNRGKSEGYEQKEREIEYNELERMKQKIYQDYKKITKIKQ